MKGRIVLMYTDKAQVKLEETAEKQGVSRTDLIRRAVSLYLVLSRELAVHPKRRIAIVEDDKIIERLILA
jgi:hypothetical protein